MNHFLNNPPVRVSALASQTSSSTSIIATKYYHILVPVRIIGSCLSPLGIVLFQMIDSVSIMNVLLREELPDVWDSLHLSELLLDSKNCIAVNIDITKENIPKNNGTVSDQKSPKKVTLFIYLYMILFICCTYLSDFLQKLAQQS